MLITLNLLILLFILAMMAMWATYGLFSSFLHLVIVVVAGVVAFAVWEPLAYMLLGRMPEYAWGIGLLAPFALTLIVTRVLMDKFCKMNLKFPRLADQVGGGALGAVSGLLSIGMLMIGIGFMPVPPDLMGYKPYRMVGNTVEENTDEGGGVWIPADRAAGGFFNMLSAGSMHPGLSDTAMAIYKPDITKRSAVYRLQADVNQMKSAHPDSVTVTDVYAVDANPQRLAGLMRLATINSILNGSYELPEVADTDDPAQIADAIVEEVARRYTDDDPDTKPSEIVDGLALEDAQKRIGFELNDERTNFPEFFEALVQAHTEDLLAGLSKAAGANKRLVIVDTQWSSDAAAGTYNTDGWLRVALPQIRLQTVEGEDDYKELPPIAYALEVNALTGNRVLVDLFSAQHHAAYAQDNNVKISWFFAVDPKASPFRFEARQLNFMLADLGAVNSNPLALAKAMGSGELPELEDGDGKTADNGGGATQANLRGTNIGVSGAVAELSERLPKALSPNSATAIEPQKDSDPWTAFRGEQSISANAGGGGRTSRMQEIYVPKGSRLLRVEMDGQSASSLYGKARELAANLQVMKVQDTNGYQHDAIAYVLYKKDSAMDVAIRELNGAMITSLRANQLPTPSKSEKLYVYFQVPVGRTLRAFMLGTEQQDFEQPIEVVAK